jgi:oxalate decarboxylase
MGSLDAISWVGLGKVYSAFQSGNIVSLGLGAGGAPGPLALRAGVSLAAFGLGALIATRVVPEGPPRRLWARQVTWVLIGVTVVLIWFLVVWILVNGHPSVTVGNLLIALGALAAGLQTGAMLRLGVRAVFTTALTATWTAFTSDVASELAHRRAPDLRRLGTVVAAAVGGAGAGAAVMMGARDAAPVLTAGLTALVAATAAVRFEPLPTSGPGRRAPARPAIGTAASWFSRGPESRPISTPPTTTPTKESLMASIFSRSRRNGAQTVEPIVGDRGASILGPRNSVIERLNPDSLIAPETDAGTIPNLKFSYAASHNRVLSGGWAREITTRELPVSDEIAGVNMRLTPGGIRELHWHKEAEWGFVIAGSCRVTLLDEDGRLFIDDVRVGDLWYFPAGLPHSIQAFEDGVEFLLVFDNGDFSENETFLICDWFNHTPRDVLAMNFGTDRAAFDVLPTDVGHTRYIFAGEVPPAMVDDAPPYPAVQPPLSYTWHMLAQEPIKVPGGQVRITDSRNFTISKAIAAAHVEVEPGGIRELHWHPTASEWQYYLAGQGRMTVFASGGKARTFDYQAGDVGYVPFAMGHYVQNTGDDPLVFLEMFRADHYADISLSQWMGVLPRKLLKAHLNLDDELIANLPKNKPVIAR